MNEASHEPRPLLAIPALITALANARQDTAVLFLGSRLELTPLQERFLDRILQSRRPSLSARALRLRDAHRRMVDDCVSLQASPEALRAARAQVEELASGLMAEVGQASRDIEAILDPAQLARTARFREDAAARLEGIRTYLTALWPQAQGPAVRGQTPARTFPTPSQGANR